MRSTAASVSRPYAEAAAALGITDAVLLARLEAIIAAINAASWKPCAMTARCRRRASPPARW
ncbi:hypothetical protein [Cupriavidus taiwanensis]|uniref:hypothetical protein n=1 Tax=Cupriavidus taiwanensis TaxID=164546 RepID=UPI002163AECA|nr:hypothetical protein [Cupriavidus taiwanensis]